MTIRHIKIAGRPYVSHDSWYFGDYGGYGSSGLANIRYLTEQCADSYIEVWVKDLHHASEGCPYGLGQAVADEVSRYKPNLIITNCPYGGQSAWIRAGLERVYRFADTCEDYPCLDDEMSSRIEMEWTDEAWESWIKRDLIRTLDDDNSDDDFPSTQDWAEELPESVLVEAFYESMEKTNTYPEAEDSSVHINIDRIKGEFSKIINDHLDGLRPHAIHAKARHQHRVNNAQKDPQEGQ